MTLAKNSSVFQRVLAGIVFGLAGLALNQLDFSLLTPETPMFVFGGIPVLFAFVRFGFLGGVTAGVISIAWFLRDPFPLGLVTLLYVLEPAVVSRLGRRWSSLFLGELAFWWLIGLPLDWPLYRGLVGLPTAYVVLLFVKQLINGVMNVLAAEFLLLLWPRVVSWVRPRAAAELAPAQPLRPLLFKQLVLVLAPIAVLASLFYTRTAYQKTLDGSAPRQSVAAARLAATVDDLQHGRRQELASLARRVELNRALGYQTNEGALLAAAHPQRPEWLIVLSTDEAGTIVAANPAVTTLGARIAGNVAYRAYFQNTRESRTGTSAALVLVERRNDQDIKPMPVLVSAEPIFRRDASFDGILLATLDPQSFDRALREADTVPGEFAVLFDDANTVVSSFGIDLEAGIDVTTVIGLAASESQHQEQFRYYPPPAESLVSRVGLDPRYATIHKVSAALPLRVLFSLDATALHRQMMRPAISVVAALSLLLLLMLAAAGRITQRIVGPLQRVNAAAAAIASGKSSANSLLDSAAKSTIAEVRTMASHLETMRGAVATRETAGAERLRLALQVAQLSTLAWDPTQDVLLAEDGEDPVFGKHQPQTGAQLLGLFDADERRQLEVAMCEAASFGKEQNLELATASAGAIGERRFAFKIAPHESSRGGVREAILVIRDTTVQRAAEQAVKESEARYRTLFELAPLGVRLVDDQGQVVDFNDAMLLPSGYRREEIQTLAGVHELYCDPADCHEIGRHIPPGGLEQEVRYRRSDDSWFLGRNRSVAVELHGKAHVLTMVEDVTERHELQAQMLRVQRLDAVGRLAGGLAHDFNNLMNVVLGNIELLETKPHASRENLSMLASARQAAHLAANLTKQLLVFSRKQTTEKSPVDLGGLVQELQPMLQSYLGHRAELTVSVAPGLRPVLADGGQVKQVVINLVSNAGGAIGRHGRICIEIDNVLRNEAPHSETAAQTDFVRLVVSDNGAGMNEAARERAFEPFFSTKAPGEGTGLGLAICYGVVTEAGGTIQIESEEGKGTRVEVLLPCPAGEPATDPQGPAGNEQRGVVLVVEDQDDLRDLICRMLAAGNFESLACRDARGALAYLEDGRPLDLLLTDLDLPGMVGTELARLAEQARPGLPVLFVSGRPDLLGKADLAVGHRDFLPKPFTLAKLIARINLLLEGKRNGDTRPS